MTNILVTAIGGSGHGDQILKALRLASRPGYRIMGADSSGECPQRFDVDTFTVLPRATDPSYLDALLAFCDAMQVQVLFHGCEPELRVFAENRERIEQHGILLPINRSHVIETCMEKARLDARLADLGFDLLKSWQVAKLDDASLIDVFPVVVKPSRGSGGSASVHIAQTVQELEALLIYLGIGKNEEAYVVQEYVGTPDAEYTVGVLHDLNGDFVDAIAVQRDLGSGLSVRLSVPNRTPRSDLGSRLVISSGVSQGLVGKFPEITSQAREIAEALGSAGPLNLQCRLVDGRLRVFEINPRYSGTTSLRALVGFNEPDLMIRRHLYGEEVPRDLNWPQTRIMRVLTERVSSGILR